MDQSVIVRTSTPADADAMAAIYGWHAVHGFGTFEEAAPTTADMAARRAAIVAKGLPHFIAEDDGGVLGFAYAGPFRPRAAYRYTVEDSVYVAPDAVGRGVGRLLLAQVLRACENLGVRQVMAVIGDSGNAASIGLHRSLGFEPAGVGRNLGFKHGRWVDIVWMQKALNGGAETAPQGPGVDLS
ncbi:GNAT family N-acetyltransferase [Phenylobacterium immobile]|uniref:GNAT family N-acetyltransferase n=1 Tax=Phenylobacterium immobile TaxID=21 RepID=UPI000B080F7B|nr:GNAT family N-acetyltransferase [Phenylobacterium immobile]